MSGSDLRPPAARSNAAPSHAARFLPAQPPAPKHQRAPSAVSLQAEIVKIIPTAAADLRSIARLGAGLAQGTIKVPMLGDPSPPGLGSRPDGLQNGQGQLVSQLARFVVVGVASTVAYVLLYVLVAASLVATAIRFALYRSWVFRGRGGRERPPSRQASPPSRAAGPETTPI
jgi:hypothetical protein